MKPLPSKGAIVSSPEKISPCKICHSPIFWESISRDGKKICGVCDPPASDSLVFAKWVIRTEGDIHTWQRYGEAKRELEFAIRRKVALEQIENIKNENPETSPQDFTPREFLPRWSPPDADGWCHGVDVDGGEHFRHKSLLPRTDRFIGDGRRAAESEENYLRRLEQYRRIREPSLRWLDETEAEWRARCERMNIGLAAA